MLKKLLRYDFASVMKVWGVGAIASVLLALVGAFAARILDAERELPVVVTVFAGFAMFFVILGFAAFSILTTVAVFNRFYKNFFTDEGYLTFTLPVKRAQLLNSKLISATSFLAMTVLVLFLDLVLFILAGLAPGWEEIAELFRDIFQWLAEHMDVYFVIYLVEGIALVLLSTVFSVLFLFVCITVACMIAKKAKVITAVAIYYVTNGIVSYAVQLLVIFGLPGLVDRILLLAESSNINPILSLTFFGLTLFVAIFCALLYLLQYWLLDRKLNLA